LIVTRIASAGSAAVVNNTTLKQIARTAAWLNLPLPIGPRYVTFFDVETETAEASA
jgi:hypothetical protein